MRRCKKIQIHQDKGFMESMATPSRVYEYDIISKEKIGKETEIPSGHDPSKYIIERIKARSHDGRMIPISLINIKTQNKMENQSSSLRLRCI